MEHDTSRQAHNAEPDTPENAVATLATAAEDPAVDPCDLACDAMPGLVLGELPPGDKYWVIEHTQTCNYCNRMLGGYQKLDTVLDRISDDFSNLHPPRPKLPLARPAGYDAIESPIGPLFVACSDKGVCEIGFGESETEQQFLQHLRTRGFRPVRNSQAVANVAEQLAEYFKGERNRFEVPFDVSGISTFTQSVLEATAEIPFGHLTSYRGIAEKIGHPSATRAVGNALGRNPIPVVIPCHRIVRSDSSIGGYTGGLKIKERLLALEGVRLPTH